MSNGVVICERLDVSIDYCGFFVLYKFGSFHCLFMYFEGLVYSQLRFLSRKLYSYFLGGGRDLSFLNTTIKTNEVLSFQIIRESIVLVYCLAEIYL